MQIELPNTCLFLGPWEKLLVGTKLYPPPYKEKYHTMSHVERYLKVRYVVVQIAVNVYIAWSTIKVNFKGESQW